MRFALTGALPRTLVVLVVLHPPPPGRARRALVPEHPKVTPLAQGGAQAARPQRSRHWGGEGEQKRLEQEHAATSQTGRGVARADQ